MRIAYDNLVDSATAPTALTEDLLYPIENVQNQRLVKRWRSTDASAQNVVIDLSTASAVDTIAILGHTFTDAATLTIEANASDTWGAPSYSTTLSYNSGIILKYLTSAETYRYWRFVMDDASNPNAYIDVGRFWLGEYLDIDPSSLLNFSVTKRRSDTVTYGRDRQKYATEGVGWRAFSFSFPRTGGTMLTAIQTMYDTAGNHSSVVFSNFNTDRNYPIVEPVHCSIVGDISFTHTRRMKFEYSLQLEEDR